jgi:hypothetical protein
VTSEERKVVVDIRTMDDDTFIKHMNARHIGGNLPLAPLDLKDGGGTRVTLQGWRAWHDHAHYWADVRAYGYQNMHHDHEES